MGSRRGLQWPQKLTCYLFCIWQSKRLTLALPVGFLNKRDQIYLLLLSVYVKDLKDTSHSVIFRECKYAIRDSRNFYPQNMAGIARLGNVSFEFAPLHASHA